MPCFDDIHTHTEEELRQAMELLFFAYRDFTGEADALLSDFGFGRAHHRVIYFVGRNPGIGVNELLAILRITKQSLSRVLRQLLDQGFIIQHPDHQDHRRRLLHLTDKGRKLELRLSGIQGKLIADALKKSGEEAASGFRSVLQNMINRQDRGKP